MDDNALNYEYLIRRGHQCGRYGVAGADADTFRQLQRTAHEYFHAKAHDLDTKDQLYAEYMINAGKVSAYMNTAITKVLDKYGDKLNDAQYNLLEEVRVTLINPNIENIGESIKIAEQAMIEIGLYPQ